MTTTGLILGLSLAVFGGIMAFVANRYATRKWPTAAH